MSAHETQKEGQRILPDAASIDQKIREALRIKHYAYSTEKTYTEWFQRFYNYLTGIKKKDWDAQGGDEEDVRDFLSHLAIKQHVSSSTQNQAFNALLFLFRNVLQVDLKDLSQTVRAKRGQKLPVVLSVDEVRQLLSQLSGRDLLLVHIIYGTGMRVMEAARLRVNDIDFGTNAIFVRGGKGDKDRTTVLPQAVIDPLKAHLTAVKDCMRRIWQTGWERFTCRRHWRENTRMQGKNGAGSTCFRQIICRLIRTQARCAAIISAPTLFRRLLPRRSGPPVSPSTPRCIRCAIVSRRIC